MKNKILVNPDVHGRHFWEKSIKYIEDFDKVIFLGDYLDPYGFEKITVKDAIDNFKKIIEFKKKNTDKVVLLLGNHDMPYFSKKYFGFSTYHCRHSSVHHNEIKKLFEENCEFFKIAHVEKDIIFTHAGIERGWLENIVKCNIDTDLNEICKKINNLLNDEKGLLKLFMVTYKRGGRDKYGSCIWTDITDIEYEAFNYKGLPFEFKQIFGHTLRAFYDKDFKIVFGEPIEFRNHKMIDTARTYILDIDNFDIKKLE